MASRTRARPRPVPPRELGEVLDAFPHLRQSTLGDFDNCPLSSLFDLEGYSFSSAEQARGTVFHRYAAEVLRTLHAKQETTMPVSEALTILYEQAAQRDVPSQDVVWVPTSERRLLRIAAVMLVWDNVRERLRPFGVDKLLPNGIELRLYATVRYPESRACRACDGRTFVEVPAAGPARENGTPPEPAPEQCGHCGGWGRELTGAMVERVITGQLDALLAEPGGGAVVVDWKTTRKAPPPYAGKHVDERGRVDGSMVDAGLSYLGYFQQRVYALLVLHNFPSLNRVTLREVYPLDGNMEVRTSTVTREHDLEHIEQELAALSEIMDRALGEGSGSPIWEPRPGRHCDWCRAPARCPIEPEAREAAGGITSKREAAKVGAEAVVADAVRSKSIAALKEWVTVYGPVDVRSAKGRYQWRFKGSATGRGRGSFGVHVPEASDRGPEDPELVGALMEARDKKRIEAEEAVA